MTLYSRLVPRSSIARQRPLLSSFFPPCPPFSHVQEQQAGNCYQRGNSNAKTHSNIMRILTVISADFTPISNCAILENRPSLNIDIEALCTTSICERKMTTPPHGFHHSYGHPRIWCYCTSRIRMPFRCPQAWFDLWAANVQSRQYWAQAASFHVGSVHDPLEMRPLLKQS